MNKEEFNIEEYMFNKPQDIMFLTNECIEMIIAALQLDRKEWINQYTKSHNDYIDLQQENEEYKEVIDKIDKKINDFIKCCKAEKIESGSDFLHHSYWNMFENFNKQIKEILKEVKE